jgi:hypothetical protein
MISNAKPSLVAIETMYEAGTKPDEGQLVSPIAESARFP